MGHFGISGKAPGRDESRDKSMDGSDDSPPDGSGAVASPAQEKGDAGAVTQVKVAVRVRPLIGMERAAGCQPCMFGDSDNSQVG